MAQSLKKYFYSKMWDASGTGMDYLYPTHVTELHTHKNIADFSKETWTSHNSTSVVYTVQRDII
jgi:hypothetical protein